MSRAERLRVRDGADDRVESTFRVCRRERGVTLGKGTRDKTRHARHDPNMEGANYAI